MARTVGNGMLCFAVIWLTVFSVCYAYQGAKDLYRDLLRNSGYNKLIRPVKNISDTLTVKLSMSLSQLIDVVSEYYDKYYVGYPV